MSRRVNGNLPYRGSPIIVCPICGLEVHLEDTRWNGREWVDERCYDEPGYREKGRTAPRPHPLDRQRRTPPPRV